MKNKEMNLYKEIYDLVLKKERECDCKVDTLTFHSYDDWNGEEVVIKIKNKINNSNDLKELILKHYKKERDYYIKILLDENRVYIDITFILAELNILNKDIIHVKEYLFIDEIIRNNNGVLSSNRGDKYEK